MALQTQDLMMRLQPLSPISSGMGDLQNMSMERQRMKLAREQFEEVKRKNAEDAELHRIAEAGEMTRAKMQAERERAKEEAAVRAEAMKQRLAAHADMLKYEDAGDLEGMENAANRLNEMGGAADRLGEDEHGMPSWRVETDPERAQQEQAAQDRQLEPGPIDNPENPYSAHPGDESLHSSLSRLGALGYGKLGTRGNLDETTPGAAEPLSTEDAFRQAQAATRAPAVPEAPPAALQPGVPYSDQFLGEKDAAENFAEPGRSTPMPAAPELPPSRFEQTGRPARGPDQADIMGGVPKNVIDTGAMAEQTKRRLGPVMAGIEASMPEAYRQSTKDVDTAVLGAGLSGPDALKESLSLRAPANAAIKDELDTERDVKKAERKAIADAKLDPAGEQKLVDFGNKRANKTYQQNKIKDSLDTMRSADTVAHLLDDEFPENDDYAINFLMTLAKNKGHQSESDAERMTGLSSASTIDQIKSWIHKHVEGGTYEDMKASMKSFASSLRAQDQENVFSWIHSTHEAADAADHPLVAKGYNEAVASLPDWAIKEYNDSLPPEEQTQAEEAPGKGEPADDTDSEDTLGAAAEQYGIDPDKMRQVMGPESKGDPSAKNPHSSASGIIQMIDKVARRYVNPRTGKKFENAAELRTLTRAEQEPIAAQYLHDSGVDEDSPVEDYALAVAAPAFVGKSADRNAVVYEKGTGDYEANKPWWPADGGDITVGSILDFYQGKKSKPAAEKKPAKQAAGKGADDAKLLEGI